MRVHTEFPSNLREVQADNRSCFLLIQKIKSLSKKINTSDSSESDWIGIFEALLAFHLCDIHIYVCVYIHIFLLIYKSNEAASVIETKKKNVTKQLKLIS